MRNVAPGELGLVRRRTLAVWPGVMMRVPVSKGFTCTASTSTMVRVWLAMLK